MKPQLTTKAVVYVALVANLLTCLLKFAAAGWTGSSVMLSEGVHSTAEMGNEALLLYGLYRANKPADRDHPLGYGRELYFWSFAVALLLFVLGAIVSMDQGIEHMLNPVAIHDPTVSYVVLGCSALIDGTSWWIELRSFKGTRRYSEVLGAIFRSKDPPSFVVLFEDSASLIGILIAFTGTYLSVRLNLPILDGAASVLIGLVIGAMALLLARETKSLLIGERADQSIVDSISEIAESMEGVSHANGILTVHLSPRQILAALSLEFDDDLSTQMIESKVAELERNVRVKHPEVVALFVKPQSHDGFLKGIEHRFPGARGTLQ